MPSTTTIVGMYAEPIDAQHGVAMLATSGSAMADVSVVGVGCCPSGRHRSVFSVNAGADHQMSRGVFWGNFWKASFGGLFSTITVRGNLIVLGRLSLPMSKPLVQRTASRDFDEIDAAMRISGASHAVVAACDIALKEDGCLVIAHVNNCGADMTENILRDTGAWRVERCVDDALWTGRRTELGRHFSDTAARDLWQPAA